MPRTCLWNCFWTYIAFLWRTWPTSNRLLRGHVHRQTSSSWSPSITAFWNRNVECPWPSPFGCSEVQQQCWRIPQRVPEPSWSVLTKFLETHCGPQNEQAMVNADVVRLSGDQAPAPKRRKYKDLQKRIKTIITQYNARDRSLMDTMEGLAFAFMF